MTDGDLQRLADLEKRIAALESRVPKPTVDMEAEDTSHILAIVRQTPGMSQRSVCHCARELYGVPKNTTREILRGGVGRLWDVELGSWGSYLYTPINKCAEQCGTVKADSPLNGGGTAEPMSATTPDHGANGSNCLKGKGA
jgi:hypothetical protein